ncbi:alpha/beta hydrolase family protein [Chryseobacterium candidae]|uniref:S9 family peptidase n=1 Tax=Chryseobacterium candidae TaxID=1978493 RepID=A0ABY2R4E7_9FLAO|nr:prolyl oligopeptidase family serine peptidase [Chryseobacterium candidae]THV57552.1 S9 family peptidase [Chryseobacterium candidae]
MMDIKASHIDYITFKSFLWRNFSVVVWILWIFLLIIMPQNLSAQRYEHLEKLVKDTEEMKFPEASDNGKWLAWYIFSVDGTKKMLLQRTGDKDHRTERKNIDFIIWVGNDLAIQTKDTLEYLYPETGKFRFFYHVKKCIYNKQQHAFMVLYTEKDESRLEVYDTDLSLRQSISGIQHIYSEGDETIARRKTGDLIEALILKNGVFETIFSTHDELSNILPSGMKQKGFVIQTRKKGKTNLYYVSQDKKQYIFDGSSYADYDQMMLNPSRSDNSIALKLGKRILPAKGMVDIWYGTDFDLKKHAKVVTEFIRVDWEPVSGKQVLMTRSGYFEETAIGHSRYLMYETDKQQVDKMDKAGGNSFDRLYLWNAVTGTYTLITDLRKQMVISPSGQYLLIQRENNWQLYNTLTLVMEDVKVSAAMVPYFISGKEVLWVGGNRILEYNLTTQKKKEIFTASDDSEIELVDFTRISTELGYGRDFRTTDIKKSLLLKITDSKNSYTSYASLKNSRLQIIQQPTPDEITELKRMNEDENYYWIEENYNKRPGLVVKKGKEDSKVMYVSEENNQKFEQAELIKISYKGSDGETISGALYMPLGYDRSKKYPVVIHVYEKQDYMTKRFLRPSFSNPTGLNIPLLMEEGFAVLLADISQSDKGAGISALESINNALDELQKIRNVDMTKIGLMGQSFGGYETNFIAGHSNRFAAYVSGSAVSDVVRTYYGYNYHFNAPDYYRYEGRQYWFKATLAENPGKYIKNNPIMFAQNVSAPMLLWTGADDGNVSPEGTKSMFIALRKYRKPVIALFYDKEGHSLSRAEAQKDLTLKILDWFNYHLKNEKNIPWIQKYIKGAQ